MEDFLNLAGKGAGSHTGELVEQQEQQEDAEIPNTTDEQREDQLVEDAELDGDQDTKEIGEALGERSEGNDDQDAELTKEVLGENHQSGPSQQVETPH